MSLDDVGERNPLSDARADLAGREELEEMLQILLEPIGMARSHKVD